MEVLRNGPSGARTSVCASVCGAGGLAAEARAPRGVPVMTINRWRYKGGGAEGKAGRQARPLLADDLLGGSTSRRSLPVRPLHWSDLELYGRSTEEKTPC